MNNLHQLSNGRMISKLYANLCGMIMFSWICLFSSLKYPHFTVLASLFSTGLYIFLIYYAMWEAGSKMSVSPIKPSDDVSLKRAVYIMVCGNAAALGLTFLYIIFGAMTQAGAITAESALANFNPGIPLQIIQPMFVGFENIVFGFADLPRALYFLFCISAVIAVGTVGYMLGVRGDSISKRLGIKWPEKKSK